MRGSAKIRVREQDGSEVGGEDLARNTLITCSVASASHPLLKKRINIQYLTHVLLETCQSAPKS